ncbi:MAG: hypothetical protein OHK0023_12640 [Anaerolineae bacterium]
MNLTLWPPLRQRRGGVTVWASYGVGEGRCAPFSARGERGWGIGVNAKD